jgi:hypothetical protein
MTTFKRFICSVSIFAMTCSLGCSSDDGQRGIGGSSATDMAVTESDRGNVDNGADGGLVSDVSLGDAQMVGFDGEVEPADATSSDAEISNLDAQVADVSPIVDAQPISPDMFIEAWVPDPTPLNPIITNTGPDLELLLVGDNYIGLNGLCEKLVALAQGAALWDSVLCEMVTSGGFRLINHADAAASGERLGEFLNSQDPTRTFFDLMILQERAQVSGFPTGQPYRTDFEQAAEELAIRANGAGIPTALLMSWGRSDDPNMGLYPDYETMQERIAEAHYEVAQNISQPGQEVAVIEAGEVWFRTHERSPSMDFLSLLMPNDHHPSEIGSWLLAAVILSRTVGLSPAMLPLLPEMPSGDLWLRLKADVVDN